MPESYKVALIGGGITGLVAAYTLSKQLERVGTEPEIVLLEGAARLGGKLQSVEFAGTTVDTGAEAFVAQGGRELCRELGIEDELLSLKTNRTNIWARGRLRALPGGLALGVPTNPFLVAKTGLISLPGLLRAGLDLALPRTKLSADPSIAQALGARLGGEMLDRLVEPLLGGIHAGRAEQLSLLAVAPQLAAVAKRERSLILGLRVLKKSMAGKSGSGVPQLLTFEAGMLRLIERLDEAAHGVDSRTGWRVERIEPQQDGGYLLHGSEGAQVTARCIVLTIPAYEAARLLTGIEPEAANELAGIEHASVMVTHLAYRPEALPAGRLQGSGFLAPYADGRLINACTLLNNKWPRQNASGLLVFRCSAGRAGDERAAHMSDTELVAVLHQELVAALGLREAPVESQVTRWQRAFPQYNVGHQARIQRVEHLLQARLPGLLLAGAAYHGLGLASCIKDGRQIALTAQRYLL